MAGHLRLFFAVVSQKSRNCVLSVDTNDKIAIGAAKISICREDWRFSLRKLSAGQHIG